MIVGQRALCGLRLTDAVRLRHCSGISAGIVNVHAAANQSVRRTHDVDAACTTQSAPAQIDRTAGSGRNGRAIRRDRRALFAGRGNFVHLIVTKLLLGLYVWCSFCLVLAINGTADENRGCYEGAYELIHTASMGMVDNARPSTQIGGSAWRTIGTRLLAIPHGTARYRHSVFMRLRASANAESKHI